MSFSTTGRLMANQNTKWNRRKVYF